MKAKFLTTLFLLITVMSFAQNEKNEHLSFKGVPIDGNLGEYVLKMKQNGFAHLGTENETASLKGDFAGYKDCMIEVSTLKQKDLVHKISVLFPNRDTWSTLFDNYSSLKEMLTEKYGKPFDILEKFDGGYQPEEDRMKLSRVWSDNCKYKSVWQTDKGDIQLSIEHKSTRCFVRLAYIDKANGNVIREKAKDDL
ncbi:hypothetical protein [Pedobacter helvus]|uniref:Uncharacterized protein n=1 Tax=Pedobacter helvus TaxID=2563444 RepID=A0ABW9JFM0_9SPHI|nr:hypothetical protein [Pedobacter ureilyticus]